MKKIVFSVLALIVLSLTSCSTDFQLEGEWKDIPVVYGFVSIQDTAHYVRVEKAFLEVGGNANDIAQNVDSIYYDDITVEFVRSNGDAYQLQRVDGNLEGYPREDGPFATSPNYLYKIKANEINLQGSEPLMIRINRGDDLEPVTAETIVIGEIEISEERPSPTVNLEYNRFVRTNWSSELETKVFDVKFIFNYKEQTPETQNEFVDRSVTWNYRSQLLRDENSSSVVTRVEPRGEEFYQFLGSAIPNLPEAVRVFEDIDIQVTGSGEEIKELVEIARANSGITSSQVIPVYSNISDGIGFFSSRYTAIREGITLNFSSRDSLINGIYTRNLNFQ